MAVVVPKVEHINPFLAATVDTFSTMIGMQAAPGKPHIKQGSGVQYDISGVIGLSGEARGSVIISFPRLTAIKVVTSFLGEKVVSLDGDVCDAVGELANIIAGSAKKSLADFKVNISLPTVVMGEHHRIVEPKDVICMVIPFSCEAGNFDVAVNLQSS
jgi:chemotaxis protein CheX